MGKSPDALRDPRDVHAVHTGLGNRHPTAMERSSNTPGTRHSGGEAATVRILESATARAPGHHQRDMRACYPARCSRRPLMPSIDHYRRCGGLLEGVRRMGEPEMDDCDSALLGNRLYWCVPLAASSPLLYAVGILTRAILRRLHNLECYVRRVLLSSSRVDSGASGP